jgi:hypothetical protein
MKPRTVDVTKRIMLQQIVKGEQVQLFLQYIGTQRSDSLQEFDRRSQYGMIDSDEQ